MKRVIYVGEEPKGEKGVEFTHFLDGTSGWHKAGLAPIDFEKIVYLGNCLQDGDMFSAYDDDSHIFIFKGHLNNGTF